jgi:hypothetical protein
MLTRAFVWLEERELEAAREDAERCINICVELEHPIGEAMASLVIVWADIEGGDVESAAERLAHCLAVARECGYQVLLCYCLAAQAELSARAGDHELTARLLGGLGSTSALLGGEGARVLAARLAGLRQLLGSRLAGELAEASAEGARQPLEELAAAVSS